MLYSDITAFTFPSVHNNETEPGMSESKSQVSTSGNDLVCKYGATSATSKKNHIALQNMQENCSRQGLRRKRMIDYN